MRRRERPAGDEGEAAEHQGGNSAAIDQNNPSLSPAVAHGVARSAVRGHASSSLTNN